MSAKVSKTKAVTTPYEPKPREKAAIDAYHARRARKSPSPDLKITKGQEQVRVEPDHPDNATGSRLLMNALGTTSPAFYEGLIGQLVNASGKGQEPDEGAVNFSLSVIKSIQPQDEIEAMLAAQMAAVHMASMSFGGYSEISRSGQGFGLGFSVLMDPVAAGTVGTAKRPAN